MDVFGSFAFACELDRVVRKSKCAKLADAVYKKLVRKCLSYCSTLH